MENCGEMERDHYFCGSMSTTRSHNRNQEPPRWNKHFVSTAAHFLAVSVAIIMEIGQLKCFSGCHWHMLPFILALTHLFFRYFCVVVFLIRKKVQGARKLKAQCGL